MPVAVKTSRSELYAVAFLLSKGLDREDILKELGMSRRTYYRRVEQLGRMEASAKRPRRESA